MRKLPRAGQLGDILHKGFVMTCVGVTVYGLANVGSRIYNYYTVIKPQRLAEEEREKRLNEGNNFGEPELRDIAAPLKA